MSKFNLMSDLDHVDGDELTAPERDELLHLIQEHTCCGSCKYWGDWGDEQLGPPAWKVIEAGEDRLQWVEFTNLCKRFPPVAAIGSDGEWTDSRPVTDCNDWCGEHVSRVDHMQ